MDLQHLAEIVCPTHRSCTRSETRRKVVEVIEIALREDRLEREKAVALERVTYSKALKVLECLGRFLDWHDNVESDITQHRRLFEEMNKSYTEYKSSLDNKP